MKNVLMILLLFVGCAQADVYKSVDDQGGVIYSDQPSAAAKKMVLPKLPTYTAPPLPPATPANARTTRSVADYEAFSVSKPLDGSTLRSNLGVVQVELSLKPALKDVDRHRIQYYLDNEPYGPLVGALAITISNLERGTHTLSASIVDADNRELISAQPVTVHLKRQSRLHKQDVIDDDLKKADGENGDQAEAITNPNIRTLNPNIRTPNPNIRTLNPNIRTPNPNIISPPPTQ